MVPTAYSEVVNLKTPEYPWAQGLMVALHSLRYAYCNNPSCDPMPLGAAAKQLDTIRLSHNLLMIPPSEYYMANCRTLHSEEVLGPTAVSGWKRYVSGQPYVQSRNILIVGDSGTEIYSKSGQSHHSIATDLRQHCGYSNIHNLTEVCTHPRRWLELLTHWETNIYKSHFPSRVSLTLLHTLAAISFSS